MIYLLLGDDYASKDKKIAEIKSTFFPSPEALQFDCETLSAHKLTAEALKKVLIALPAVAKQRLVIIRQCEKLSTQNKDLLLRFAQKPLNTCSLILDVDEDDDKDVFLEKIDKFTKKIHLNSGVHLKTFDLMNAIDRKNQTEALKVVNSLLGQGEHPLQILGGLLWHWRPSRLKVSIKNFEEGLRALGDADLNVKRSRLKPEYALEVAVVKLFGLRSSY